MQDDFLTVQFVQLIRAMSKLSLSITTLLHKPKKNLVSLSSAEKYVFPFNLFMNTHKSGCNGS